MVDTRWKNRDGKRDLEAEKYRRENEKKKKKEEE